MIGSACTNSPVSIQIKNKIKITNIQLKRQGFPTLFMNEWCLCSVFLVYSSSEYTIAQPRKSSFDRIYDRTFAPPFARGSGFIRLLLNRCRSILNGTQYSDGIWGNLILLVFVCMTSSIMPYSTASYGVMKKSRSQSSSILLLGWSVYWAMYVFRRSLV